MGISVLLADDHQITRDGLRALLEREGFTWWGEASNGQDAIRLTQELPTRYRRAGSLDAAW